MTKYTIQERFYIFAAITLTYACGYQFYFNSQQDKYINKALEGHNKTYQRAVEINNQLREENTALKHNLIHEQAMYEASKGHVDMLSEQINIISGYYSEKMIEVNDKLFDLKNTKKIEPSPKKKIN
jgi:hypothetical protein